MERSSKETKLKKPCKSVRKRSANGQTMEPSDLSVAPVTSVCTTSEITSPNVASTKPQKRNKRSATAASPATANATTSVAKSRTCKKGSLPTASSTTSDQVSTSNAKVYGPSWISHAAETSPKSWLPTEIGSADSHSNSSSGYFIRTKSNSWYSISKWTPVAEQSLQRTSLPSSTFSIAESTEGESIKKKAKKEPSSMRVRKWRLRPDQETTMKLKQWMGCARATYNWALGCIKAKPAQYKINMFWLRKRFINQCNIPKSKRYLLDTPKHVRDSAIEDLVNAYKTNFEKRKKDPTHNFDIKFRSKKQGESAITIPSTAVKLIHNSTVDHALKMYPTFLKNAIKLRTRVGDDTP